MAYFVKYYKSIESYGHDWRIEILQDTIDAPETQVIGPVLQGMRLKVQGDQADIDTPIVKTSLEMTFADAPDLEDERKCGYWEEFYTSSATEYKVILYKDGKEEWSGYVTPDSYSESLQYRGSVTIIARDNLGALQDYEFDAVDDGTGMIALNALINKALGVVSFPMQYEWKSYDSRRLAFSTAVSDEPFVDQILFNHIEFKEKTWWEVLESTLYATGLTLRYVGGNKFMVASIRDIPLYDKSFWGDVPVKETIFCSYGYRELSPAVKTLVDEVNFEIEEDIAESDMPNDAYGEEGVCTILPLSENVTFPAVQNVPIHAVVNGTWKPRSVSESLLLNPFKYKLKEGFSSKKIGDLTDPSIVYAVANQYDSELGARGRTAEWQMIIGAGSYHFSFALGIPAALYDNNTKIGHIDYDVDFSRFQYQLQFISEDGIEVHEYRTSSNSWIDNLVSDPNSLFPNVPFPVKYEIPELTVEKKGTLKLVIHYVGVIQLLGSEGVSVGAWVPIKDITLTDANLDNLFIPDSQKTTTHYNQKNNIRLQRSIGYGFNDADVANPKIIRNGMYILSEDNWYQSTDQWCFNPGDIPKPMPVLLHQQLLAYYAKPNNVLTGEIATIDPIFNALYEWNGKKHYLLSGTLNILTGRMESAVLREFMRYDHMWETWVEQDVIEVDYKSGRITQLVHSNKTLTIDDIRGVPRNWMYVTIKKIGDQLYEIALGYDYNYSFAMRSVDIFIDGAILRFVQSFYNGEDFVGDYSKDYNEDYFK